MQKVKVYSTFLKPFCHSTEYWYMPLIKSVQYPTDFDMLLGPGLPFITDHLDLPQWLIWKDQIYAGTINQPGVWDFIVLDSKGVKAKMVHVMYRVKPCSSMLVTIGNQADRCSCLPRKTTITNTRQSNIYSTTVSSKARDIKLFKKVDSHTLNSTSTKEIGRLLYYIYLDMMHQKPWRFNITKTLSMYKNNYICIM